LRASKNYTRRQFAGCSLTSPASFGWGMGAAEAVVSTILCEFLARSLSECSIA
jgi:hypothetical protein